jgi:MoaA/NifB/PqqE/SkfB family radical SAM enzyme
MRMSFGGRTSARTLERPPWHKRPRFCFYYVTDLCNARCGYCHFGDARASDGQRHFAAIEDVESNLDALPRLGVRFVDFTGGEPLLHPDTVRFLAMAKARGLTTGLTTNGTLFERYAVGLSRHVDHLEFSLDAANAAIHDERRPGTSFDQIEHNLALALRLGMHPAVIMTVSDDNVGELADVYRMTRSFGVRLILNPEFAAIKGRNAGAGTLDRVASFGMRRFVYVNWGLLAMYREGGNRRQRPRCCAMTAAIAIGPDNTLRGPCFHRAVAALPLHNGLVQVRMSPMATALEAQQGRLPGCEGCRISCYLELSLFYRIDRLWLLNALAIAKYEFERRTAPLWQALTGADKRGWPQTEPGN